MDLLKPIVKYLTHGFYMRRDGLNVEHYSKELNKSQYYSADELKHLQFEKLKRLLEFCYSGNSFYQRRFKECGFNPGDFRELGDLEKLPILTKDDIRTASESLFSKGYNKNNSSHRRTGGSTGVPLHTYMDYDAISFKKAATLRHNEWANLIPGNRLASIWGDTDKKLPIKARLRNALTERLFYLDTLKFDEEHINAFITQIRKYRPPILLGHAHSVFRMAEYARDNGANDLSFDGIITTAMVLNPEERKTIEAVFNSQVFNRYGCEELSIIASECEAHQGMHIFSEGLYVELFGNDKCNPRKLIITDLVNRAMPIIRYEIGDLAVFEDGECRCGRGLHRLKEVSGRTADFLYTPDRIPVFGISILDTFVIHIPGFKQIQIIQDKYDHLGFHIVKDDKFSEDSLGILKKNVIEIFGARMQYDTSFVDQIKLTERGKYRFSICNIRDNDK
jgi:phenylacetate-CoA ligase